MLCVCGNRPGRTLRCATITELCRSHIGSLPKPRTDPLASVMVWNHSSRLHGRENR